MSDEKKKVVAPGGPIPPENAHLVKAGEHLEISASGEVKVVARATPSPLFKGSPAMTNATLVLTPGGFRNASLVHYVQPQHEVQHTATVKRIRNTQTNQFNIIKEQVILPDEVPALNTGWICYASWTNDTGSPITEFKTSWVVPPEPATKGQQTIFLFNGIDPLNTSTGILQPVLQWGISAAGGGPYWAIASWYVAGDGHAYHTDLVRVGAGDRLQGVMTLASSQGGLFDYVSEFIGIAGTRLPVVGLPELVWCNETLEAYSVEQCSDYPATSKTTFGDISISTAAGPVAVTWTPQTNVSDCGQSAVVNAGAGTIDVNYA